MKKILIFFLIVFFGILLLPQNTFSAPDCPEGLNSYSADNQEICFAGFVPCGKSPETLAPGESEEVTMPCQLCHFFVMLDTILDFIFFTLVPVVAVLMLVIGGVMFMVAHFAPAEMLPGGTRGGPALLSRAKSLITSVIFGLIIIYAAWIIINAFFTVIGVAETDFGQAIKNWFSIPCQIKLPQP